MRRCLARECLRRGNYCRAKVTQRIRPGFTSRRCYAESNLQIFRNRRVLVGPAILALRRSNSHQSCPGRSAMRLPQEASCTAGPGPPKAQAVGAAPALRSDKGCRTASGTGFSLTGFCLDQRPAGGRLIGLRAVGRRRGVGVGVGVADALHDTVGQPDRGADRRRRERLP